MAQPLSTALGKPTVEHELMRGGIPLAACALIVGLPFMFLWRAYRKAVPGLGFCAK
jgi:hypothetical protein